MSKFKLVLLSDSGHTKTIADNLSYSKVYYRILFRHNEQYNDLDKLDLNNCKNIIYDILFAMRELDSKNNK